MAAGETIRELAVRIPVEELGGHLSTLEDELSQGKLIELVRGETVIAEVRAPKQVIPEVPVGERVLPDFMGRMKAIWGDQVFPEGYMTQAVREDRDARG